MSELIKIIASVLRTSDRYHIDSFGFGSKFEYVVVKDLIENKKYKISVNE